MVNDIHGRDSVLGRLLADAPRQHPDFVCFNGDMLTQIETPQELFDGYLDTAGEGCSSPAGIPIFATRGTMKTAARPRPASSTTSPRRPARPTTPSGRVRSSS